MGMQSVTVLSTLRDELSGNTVVSRCVRCLRRGIPHIGRLPKWLHLSVSKVGRRLVEISCLILQESSRGNPQPRSAIYLNSIAVGLERFGKNIIVGCMDSSLHCYTTKVRHARR